MKNAFALFAGADHVMLLALAGWLAGGNMQKVVVLMWHTTWMGTSCDMNKSIWHVKLNVR